MDWTNIPMEDHFEVHEDELRVLNPCLERPAAERVTTVWGGGPQTTRTPVRSLASSAASWRALSGRWPTYRPATRTRQRSSTKSTRRDSP